MKQSKNSRRSKIGRSSAVTVDNLRKGGLHAIRCAVRDVLSQIDNKSALRVDAYAEDTFEEHLKRYRGKRLKGIKIFGEESIRDPDLDLSQERGTVALVDALDGSDLLERGLSNWCTAVVFFNPTADQGSRILAAFVGLPSNETYYATISDPRALVFRNGATHEVSKPSKRRSLRRASVCYYGQKAKNHLSVAKTPLLREMMQLEKKRAIDFRIYNLGGNPMMVKLADFIHRDAHSIDAVFDTEGQLAHDVVPGAYIAMKGGAALKNLNGTNISYEQLEDALLQPAKNRLKYVLAATEELANALCCALRERNGTESIA